MEVAENMAVLPPLPDKDDLPKDFQNELSVSFDKEAGKTSVTIESLEPVTAVYVNGNLDMIVMTRARVEETVSIAVILYGISMELNSFEGMHETIYTITFDRITNLI